MESQLDVSRTLEILDSNFLAFDTVEHVDDMIEGLLNHANLPNVMIQGRINFTLDAYRMDASALKPAVDALNQADREFFNEILAHPRRLPIPPGEGYHPVTAMIKEAGNREASLTRFQSVKTDQLMEAVAKARTGDEVFSTFFK